MNILTNKTKDKGNSPRDILLFRSIIEEEGIVEYEKNCINYLSEFVNTYIINILEEAQIYAKLCNRAKPNIEDVKYDN